VKLLEYIKYLQTESVFLILLHFLVWYGQHINNPGIESYLYSYVKPMNNYCWDIPCQSNIRYLGRRLYQKYLMILIRRCMSQGSLLEYPSCPPVIYKSRGSSYLDRGSTASLEAQDQSGQLSGIIPNT
jgi:hypothetical protein